MGCALHQRQEIDAPDPGGRLDRRNEPMKDRTEFGTLGRRHLTEIQQMPPGLDDDRSRTGRLQRSVLDEVFISSIYWSSGEEWQELGEELAGVLEVGDVPAFRYHHPGGAGNIASGCGGKPGEVSESGGVLRLRVLAKRYDVILGPDDQQCRSSAVRAGRAFPLIAAGCLSGSPPGRAGLPGPGA